MNVTAPEEAVYVFTIQGFAPELMRGVAFRRDKHFKAAGKKILKCPYCGEDFETIDSTVKVQLSCYTHKTKVICDRCIVCRICHNAVGIIFAA